MSEDSKEVSPHQIHAFRRFLKLLPHGKDRALVVLKAHLMIEEQIRQIVDERLKNAEALRDARLDCHQCICLAQSFFSPEFQPWLWASLKKLNRIRNDIAHSVAPAGLQHRMDDFVKTYPSGDWGKADEVARFELTLWSLFTSTCDLVETPSATIHQLTTGDDE